MLASYHNHTPLCHPAEGSTEEYVLHAIEKGYDIFGFSDHAPHCDASALSESRMTLSELPLYVSDIHRLRDKYSDKIKIHLGLELEYLSFYHERNMEIYRKAGIEYLILGQHYSGTDNIGNLINSFSKTDSKASYSFYVDQCIEALSLGCFSCFAHPDVFKYAGDDVFYRKESERLIRAAIKYGVPLEVNMYGLYDGRHYPNDLFWERVGALGAPVVLGRDAHSVKRVHSDEEFPAAMAFIKKHGLDLKESIELRYI